MQQGQKNNDKKVRMATLKAALQATGGQAKVRDLYQLLTAEEAAEFLALDVGTIRNLTYRRNLPCVKVGPRGVRYRLLDLIAWQEERDRPVLR